MEAGGGQAGLARGTAVGQDCALARFERGAV